MTLSVGVDRSVGVAVAVVGFVSLAGALAFTLMTLGMAVGWGGPPSVVAAYGALFAAATYLGTWPTGWGVWRALGPRGGLLGAARVVWWAWVPQLVLGAAVCVAGFCRRPSFGTSWLLSPAVALLFLLGWLAWRARARSRLSIEPPPHPPRSEYLGS